MRSSQLYGRATALATGLADHLGHCSDKPELDFESTRLHVLLDFLRHNDNSPVIAKAYDRSRGIYLSQTLEGAHAAAHEVADILAQST